MTEVNAVLAELSAWLKSRALCAEAKSVASMIVVGLNDCAKRKTKIHPTILRGIAEYVEKLGQAVGR